MFIGGAKSKLPIWLFWFRFNGYYPPIYIVVPKNIPIVMFKVSCTNQSTNIL